MLRAVADSFLSLTFPRQCRVCAGLVDDSLDGDACGSCWKKTRIFIGSEMLCSKCGAFLGEAGDSRSARCHRCDGHFYDKALSVGIYELALAASVIALKSIPHVPRRVVRLIRNAAQNADLQNNDVVIPVPLSKQRRLERGFNQAEMIAAILARSSGTALDTGSLARTLHTPIHRIGMDDKARDLTVRKAFAVARPKLIADKRVLLVDDVFTSGATTSHCARILKKHGAERVTVFTLARAVLADS